MRKRVAELESTLAAISDSGVCKGELGDKVTMILRNKFR
jgi:hypothetical protein